MTEEVPWHRRVCANLRSLCRTRPMYTKEEVFRTPLKRCLTLSHAVFFGFSIMAGTGIYVLTGDIIGHQAGASACVSYVLAGISAIFTALCYTEFATLIPRAGSVYIYTFLTIGELPAFLIGWTAVSDSIVSIAAIAKSFSGTIDVLAKGAVLNWTEAHMGRIGVGSGVLAETYDVLAAALIIVLTAIVASGAKSSLNVNAVVTVVQMSCLGLMTFTCFVYGSPESFSAEHGGFAPHGFFGIINGATIAVFAYSGFDAISNAAEEMIDPVRDIPRVMLIVVGGCIGFYCFASLGLAFLVPRELVNFSSPFVAGFERLGITWMVVVASVGTLLATGGAKVSTMFAIPRCLYAMGDDGLIFRQFACVERRTQVPLFSLIFGASVSVFLALFFDISTLAEFVSLGSLFSYFIIGVDMLVMRYLMTEDEENAEQLEALISGPSEQAETLRTIVDTIPVSMRFRDAFRWIARRYPSTRSRAFFSRLVTLHVVVVVLLSAMIDYQIFSEMLAVKLVIVAIFVAWAVTVFLLSIYKPSYTSRSYQTPLMPMAPVLTIFINAILILRLSTLTWIRFGIWSAIGLVMYFGYGRFHSVAREVKEEQFHLADPDNFGAKVPSSSYGSESHKET